MLITFTISSECISKAGLEALGLTDVLDAPVANEGTNKRCATFEKVCIQPDTVDAQIKTALQTFADGVKSQLGSLKGANKFLGRGLMRLKKAFETEKKKAKLTEKLGTEDTAIVEDLFSKCDETECNIVDADSLGDNKTCRKAIMSTMTKGLCLLLSDQGKANVSENSDGTIESLIINNAEMDLVFKDCIPYYIPLCEVTNLFGIYEKLAKDTSKHTGKAEKMNETCALIKDLNSCSATPETCDESLKIKFFTSFVALGQEVVPGPPKDQIDKQEQNVENSEKEIDTVESETSDSDSTKNTETKEETARLLSFNMRMLSTASSTCEFSVSNSGYDLTKVESGVEVEEYSAFTKIFKFSCFVIMFALIK